MRRRRSAVWLERRRRTSCNTGAAERGACAPVPCAPAGRIRGGRRTCGGSECREAQSIGARKVCCKSGHRVWGHTAGGRAPVSRASRIGGRHIVLPAHRRRGASWPMEPPEDGSIAGRWNRTSSSSHCVREHGSDRSLLRLAAASWSHHAAPAGAGGSGASGSSAGGRSSGRETRRGPGYLVTSSRM
jgi:hypothetical protein